MEEKTVSVRSIHRGRILDLEAIEVELEPGVRTQREVVRHRGAVAVLAFVPGGRLMLVRQYRKAVESEVLEIVAGCLEPGESPEQCAIREVREETLHEVERIERLGSIWPAPGYSSEELHLFAAVLKSGDGAHAADADERIEAVQVEEREFGRMIARGEIRDAKTIAAWHLWLARKGRGP